MRTSRLQGLRFGLLFAGALLGRTAYAADVPISENARMHFNAGVSLLQDPDGARYEEAYAEFKAAYADSPSWKILGNFALAAMKLERDGEAIDAYTKYLAESGPTLDPEERAQVQRDLDTLSAGVVRLELESVPPGAFITDERSATRGAIKNNYGPLTDKLQIGVRAGQHRITAHLDGYADQVWVVNVAPGTSHQHQFALKPIAAGADAPSTPVVVERPVPTSVYIGLAATGVLAVGTGVFGGLALSKHSDFESKNDGSDPADAQSLKDSGKTLNVVTDALLGGAVVAGAVTAVLYFTRPSRTADHGRLRVTPVAGPRVAGVSLMGAF